jgi:Tfp pilus assembly protein PilP
MEKAKGIRAGDMLLLVAAFALLMSLPPAVVLSSTATVEGGSGSSPDDGDSSADRTKTLTVFNPEGLRDPFKSFILEQEERDAEKARKPKTYLETVDLSQLELIAVIVASEDSWAMVRDAKGVGYVVKAGTPIGIDGGQVHEIRPGEVIIRSRHRDADGRAVTRETAKRLVQ